MRCRKNYINGLRRHESYLWLAQILTAGVILLAVPAAADIYRYTDDDGGIHYTDDIDRVPAKYKDAVQRKITLGSEGSSEAYMRRPKSTTGEQTADGPPVYPSPGESSGDKALEADVATKVGPVTEAQKGFGYSTGTEKGVGGESGTHEMDAIRRQLEQERRALLLQKESLANNRSFQKRKIKRKYKNRHHIKKLIKEEARIEPRLAEIEQELLQTN